MRNIIILIIIVLAAAAGWYFYQESQKSELEKAAQDMADEFENAAEEIFGK